MPAEVTGFVFQCLSKPFNMSLLGDFAKSAFGKGADIDNIRELLKQVEPRSVNLTALTCDSGENSDNLNVSLLYVAKLVSVSSSHEKTVKCFHSSRQHHET